MKYVERHKCAIKKYDLRDGEYHTHHILYLQFESLLSTEPYRFEIESNAPNISTAFISLVTLKREKNEI